ncbi:beta-glucosidase [Dysgonomonas macrotermitis]|uniref:Beta-glucosidase n=1 Tax=Dysgonomonas macrotermitis TaxID=1346286 RepID=A0A1M4VQA6_9BACT|nr:glycoside hydrolase family 3 C-terminal domain-containing protein [Dysgonomonas macrotermitis]SHE71291.1 beta-glucosidase [Dysgonomonas macrotermitis]
MKKYIYTAITLLLLCTQTLSAQRMYTKDPKVEQRIEKLIKKMTLKEKVGMLHGNSKFFVSGVERLGIPEWSMSDGPHGVRAEINRHDWNYSGWTNDSSTYLPTGTAFAATWNTELAYKRGQILGSEARYRKKDVLLGPGVNIIRSPLCGRNFEYFSEDPFLTARMSVPYVKGLQSRDVAASIKHYALNNQETERGTIDVYASERALHEIYLPAFKATVEEGGALTVMAAYNKFRGEWCAENKYLVRDILKGEMGFDGAYITDWGGAHSTVKSAIAGLDVEMGTEKANYNEWYFADPLIEAVQKGEIPESLVDEKVANVLRVMIRTNILDPKKRFNDGVINTKEHQQEAYQEAVEAVVLLKNENNLLPMNIGSMKSIAVIGDNATRRHCDGGLSSEIKALYEITPLEGLRRKFGDKVQINFAQGYEKTSFFVPGENNGQGAGRFSEDNKVKEGLLNEAIEAAKKSEAAIIFCGLNHDFDTESADKMYMQLPYGQIELIQEVSKVNPNTVVVIIAGSPVDLVAPSICAPAIIWGWYNGMEAGNAFADIITGKENPSGKMPFTLAYSLEQYPAHAYNNYPGRNGIVNYEDDILVGYRWFDTKKQPVVYSFGYGLSYTEFSYGKLSTDKQSYNQEDKIRVKFLLQNTGSVKGGEVAQLYVSDVESSVLRPTKELKGFRKVFLNPGESQQVEIDVPVSELGFYDEEKRAFVVEPGEFILHIASSASDIKDSISIKIQ